MEFKELTTNDYYGKSDSLSREGENFKEGNYTLRFPNGTIKKYDVKIEKYHGQIQIDMNNYPDTYTGRKAYIMLELDGATTRLYLRENKIEIGIE
jgi:hypothetical protein